jgi:hypothetical protein
MAGEWGKLYYEEIHNLYSSPNIITFIKMDEMQGVGRIHKGDEY